MAEFAQAPGVQYYLELTIKDARINPVNIQSLVIKEWVFNLVPTIEIHFIDDGYFTEIIPLEDGEDIEVLLAKNEDDENPVELTFSLDDYSVGILGDNRKSTLSITGHLKVNDIFVSKMRSFPGKNSLSVLKQIASDSNLTFVNPRNVIPSDNMNWLQVGQSNYDFIVHVLKRSYVPNDVVFFYANSSNEFVYTSLHAEMDKEDIKRAKFNVRNAERNVEDDSDKDDTIWFASYNITNYSGFFNKSCGYGFGYCYYDLSQEVFKSYKSIKKFTDLSFRNKDLLGSTIKTSDCADLIEKNVYSAKYFESLSRNEFLKNNFFGNLLVMNINSLSQVKLMDVIDVDIPSLFEEENSNEVLSGKYMVAGIQHEISTGAIYRKKIALGRNGMNKSQSVKIYQVES